MSAPSMRPQAARTIDRIGWAFAIAAVAIRIVFWRHTGRVWEDSLITILHAENALDGLGLTHYKPGEAPVHGFTSPLGVLIPLVGEWLHRGFALDTLRVASLVTAFFSVRLAARIAIAVPGLGITPPLAALVCGYLAFEHHQILWGMAGMETQVVVCVVLLSILCFALRRYAMLGLSIGLCLLARPDLGLWAVVIGIFLLVEALRERRWRPLLTTVGIAAAVYLPWIAFAWAYYGSPIPNTILAKSLGYGYWWTRGHGLDFWLGGAWYGIWASLIPPLGPAFAGHGTNFVKVFDPGWIASIVTAAILVGFGSACLRGSREVRLVYAFFWMYVAYFAYGIPMFFGWYGVPLSAIAILLAAHGLGVVLARLPLRAAPQVATGVTVAYLAAIVGILPITFHAERNIQRLIEEPVRISIGRYLHDHSPPDATVGGEPLGFIGYYSRRAYYDYPGLTSRREVDFMRTTGERGLVAMLMHFHPDYIVLRDSEIQGFGDQRAWLERNYRVERHFAVPESDRAKIFRADRNIDMAFTLFRRR